MKRRAKKAINYAAMGDDTETMTNEAMSNEAPEDVDKELERWIQLSDDFESRPSVVKCVNVDLFPVWFIQYWRSCLQG